MDLGFSDSYSSAPEGTLVQTDMMIRVLPSSAVYCAPQYEAYCSRLHLVWRCGGLLSPRGAPFPGVRLMLPTTDQHSRALSQACERVEHEASLEG
jgi:hypothetical protein